MPYACWGGVFLIAPHSKAVHPAHRIRPPLWRHREMAGKRVGNTEDDMRPIIDIDHISKRYGSGTFALNDVSLWLWR